MSIFIDGLLNIAWFQITKRIPPSWLNCQGRMIFYLCISTGSLSRSKTNAILGEFARYRIAAFALQLVYGLLICGILFFIVRAAWLKWKLKRCDTVSIQVEDYKQTIQLGQQRGKIAVPQLMLTSFMGTLFSTDQTIQFLKDGKPVLSLKVQIAQWENTQPVTMMQGKPFICSYGNQVVTLPPGWFTA